MKISSFIETFVDYKNQGILIGFPTCSGKCWKELGMDTSICQNEVLKNEVIEISLENLCKKIEDYIKSGFAKAVILAGLEPFEDTENVLSIISFIQKVSSDTDIVIYTGFNEDEITKEIGKIKAIAKNKIIIKFGRFIPNDNSVYDAVLGITLASKNQYAKQINP